MIRIPSLLPALVLVLALKGPSAVEAADSLETAGDHPAVIDSILADAVSYLGTPYVEGGTDGSGFDCSGLAWKVFGDYGIELCRTVTGIESQGIHVEREDLEPGDLMIFHDPKHVGIYLGNGEFIHCSSWQDRGVVITSIDHSNYLRRYYTARRIVLGPGEGTVGE